MERTMQAAVLRTPGSLDQDRLELETRPRPKPGPGEVLLRVEACGVCDTDIQLVQGALPVRNPTVVPGHQIIGVVVAVGDGVRLPTAMRVGTGWLWASDGHCRYCRSGYENLCDAAAFTGYDRDGGFAQFAVARADYVFPLTEGLDGLRAAPLLCAGVVGFRALRVAGVERGEYVGLYGFGGQGQLALAVLRAWGCRVAVATDSEQHRRAAERSGATWTGAGFDTPPEPLDRAIIFTSRGKAVLAALGAVRKGGVVAIKAIHLDGIPELDYDRLLSGERQIRSVSNMTRQDARDFLELAAQLDLRPQTTTFPLEAVNQALRAVRNETLEHAAVITMR